MHYIRPRFCRSSKIRQEVKAYNGFWFSKSSMKAVRTYLDKQLDPRPKGVQLLLRGGGFKPDFKETYSHL